MSEEFFQRIKDYLTRYEQTYGKKLSQKDFVIGLIEQALEEADEEFEAAQAAQKEAAGDSHETLEDTEDAEDEETADIEEQPETGEEPEEVTEPQEEQETIDSERYSPCRPERKARSAGAFLFVRKKGGGAYDGLI